MDSWILILRLVLAAIFLIAGIAKFLDLAGSEKAFKEFGIPAAIAKPSSILLSLTEIAIGAMFLSAVTSWYAALAAAALLLLFIGQMSYQAAKGNAPDCHCFGQLHSAPVGRISIARNIAFAVMALILISRGEGGQGTSLADPRLDVMQLALGLAVVAGLISAVYYLKKTAEQQTQIIRQIEVLDLVARDGGSVERETTHPHKGLPIGAVFPDFELRDATGAIKSLAHIRDAKLATLFVFVSPTCNPCQVLLPEFNEWILRLAGKVQFVFVSSGTAFENTEKFATLIDKKFLLQKERELAEAARAKWTPTAVLMNADGRIASHPAAGDVAIRELISQIESETEGGSLKYIAGTNGHAHGGKLGLPATTFALDDLEGNRITADFFINRQTLVAFWSTTCPHCVSMMNHLREWESDRKPDDPSLLVFSDGDKGEHIKLGLSSPILLDKGYKTAVLLGMSGTPSAVLVDEAGVIISETAVGSAEIFSLFRKTGLATKGTEYTK